ncbi:MAG: hypothetical protein Q9175_006423, partial [Cornicularia normoerica]
MGCIRPVCPLGCISSIPRAILMSPDGDEGKVTKRGILLSVKKRVLRVVRAYLLSLCMCTLNDNTHYAGDGPQCLPFPREVLVQVIGLLDKACDRTNARLVCKGFAEAGLPSLTFTVNLSVAGGLLDRTQAIAEHPVVSKYITQMVCSGTQLLSDHVNYDSFQDWYGLPRDHTELSPPLSVIYEQFVSRDKNEKNIIHCQRDQAIFLLALQSFVNLKRITFTDVPLVEETQHLARPQWPGVPNGGDLWEPASPYRMFALGLRLLCMWGTNLQQFKLEGSSYAMQDRIFSDASQEYYGHMLSVFGSLRYFELNVVVPDVAEPDDAQSLAYGGLRGLLAHATFLRTLKLASSYCPEPPNEDDCPPMLDIATLLQGFT